MAKKPRGRAHIRRPHPASVSRSASAQRPAPQRPAPQRPAPQRPAPQRPAPQRRWRKLVLGGVILALALGVGAVVRYRQSASLSPQLQETAVDHHYTRGTAGAPVVIKEFSDYT